MGPFDSLILAPSPKDLTLLKFLLGFALFLFVPYLALLTSSFFASVYYSLQSELRGDHRLKDFALYLLDRFAINPAIGFFLGIVPALAVAFIYSKIAAPASREWINIFVCSLKWTTAGIFWLYCFFWALGNGVLHRLLATIQKPAIAEELHPFLDKFLASPAKSRALLWVSAIAGIPTLLKGVTLFLSAKTAVLDPVLRVGSSKNLPCLSYPIFVQLFLFLSLGLFLNGLILLFFRYYWERQTEFNGQHPDLTALVNSFSSKATLYGGISLGLAYFLSLTSMPAAGLTFPGFFFTLVALLMIDLILETFLRAKIEGHLIFRRRNYIYLILMLCSFALVEVATIHSSTKLLYQGFESNNPSVATAAAPQTPAEGFNPQLIEKGKSAFATTCGACHSFDNKLVGPALKVVVPKYNGDLQALKGFIENPSKKDPNFPPMPKPPASSADIDAIAQYLLSEIK